MNVKEHLLLVAMEECDEISQRISKAIRFGLEEIEPGQELNNTDRIILEYCDLQAVIEMLQERNLFPYAESMRFPKRIMDKKLKLEKYMAYSKELGLLDR